MPSAANMVAYSQPMMPAPSTNSDLGISFRRKTSSESTNNAGSLGMSIGCRGREPVAISTFSALTRWLTCASESRTSMLLASTKRAVP